VRFYTQYSFNITVWLKKNGDYHEDVHHVNYKKWLQEKLIPNLESKSVIVADNTDDGDNDDDMSESS